MYVLVTKIPFDLGGWREKEAGAVHDERFYRHLAAKLRQRQRVCAYIYGEGEQAVLALTALAPRRDALMQLCEQICAWCEREGLGRVAAEVEPLIASIDSLS